MSGAFLISAVVLALLTSPAIEYISRISEFGASFAVISVLAYALSMASRSVTSSDSNDTEYSFVTKTAMFLAVLCIYNLIILVSSTLSIVAANSFSPVIGLAIALLYPAWEMYTMEKMLPLSVSGIFIASVFLLALIGAIGSQVYQDLEMEQFTPLKILDDQRIRRKRLN